MHALLFLLHDFRHRECYGSVTLSLSSRSYLILSPGKKSHTPPCAYLSTAGHASAWLAGAGVCGGACGGGALGGGVAGQLQVALVGEHRAAAMGSTDGLPRAIPSWSVASRSSCRRSSIRAAAMAETTSGDCRGGAKAVGREAPGGHI